MGWTPPTNVAAGAKAKSAFINQQVLDNLRHLYDTPACSLERTAALNLANNAVLAVPFDTELRDNAAMHSTVTNPERITAPISGRYLVTVRAGFAGNPTGICLVQLKESGGALHSIYRDALVQATKIVGGAKEIILGAGEYFTVELQQTSGATMALSVGDNLGVEARWVGPSD